MILYTQLPQDVLQTRMDLMILRKLREMVSILVEEWSCHQRKKKKKKIDSDKDGPDDSEEAAGVGEHSWEEWNCHHFVERNRGKSFVYNAKRSEISLAF